MKKVIRFSFIVGNTVFAQVFFAKPVLAQTATPSSESTSSTLPNAGTFTATALLMVFGVALLVLGTYFTIRQARQKS